MYKCSRSDLLTTHQNSYSTMIRTNQGEKKTSQLEVKHNIIANIIQTAQKRLSFFSVENLFLTRNYYCAPGILAFDTICAMSKRIIIQCLC